MVSSLTVAPLSDLRRSWSGDQMITVDELRDVLQGERTRVADLRSRVQNKYLRDCLVSAAGV